MTCFEWFGRVSLEFGDGPRQWQAAITQWLGFEPGTTVPESSQWQLALLPSTDAPSSSPTGLGPGAAYDSETLHLTDRNGAKLFLPLDLLSPRVEIRAEPSFAANQLRDVVLELLFLKWIQGGVLPVHAAALVRNNKGYLIPAWAASGKTRLLLSAAQSGSGLIVADEWALIADGNIFPARSYLLLMGSDLRRFGYMERVGLLDWLRLKLAARVGGVLGRLLDRTPLRLRAYRLDLQSLGQRFSQSAHLDEIVYLERSDSTSSRLEPMDRKQLVDRIWTCFVRERDGLLGLLNRAQGARADGDDAWERVRQTYCDLARNVLEGPSRRLVWSQQDDEATALGLMER